MGSGLVEPFDQGIDDPDGVVFGYLFVKACEVPIATLDLIDCI
jgi:hypothetical protein